MPKTPMSNGRDQILGSIRSALKRGEPTQQRGEPPPDDARAALEARIAAHRRNLVPARSAGTTAQRIELFVAMATEVAATVERLPSLARVPHAVADYLAAHNLPAEIRVAPDPALEAIPWAKRPTLTVTRGRPNDQDLSSLTGAVAGIAETGTLMMTSGPHHPTSLNLMPDTHIVVLHADRIVGGYEDAWDRLRAAGPGMPRTVNLITGPSRTGDIEQTIQLGAHGPRRLHILLVDAPQDAGPAS